STVGPNVAHWCTSILVLPWSVHIGVCSGAHERGAPCWKLMRARLPGEFVIDNRKNNVFPGTDFASLVRPTAKVVSAGMHSIFDLHPNCSTTLARGEVFVCGAHATCDCVEVFNHSTITSRREDLIENELEEVRVLLLKMMVLLGLYRRPRSPRYSISARSRLSQTCFTLAAEI
ncbi:hypothetical protein BD413DRAFT_485796, partial [Trametes elegans]